MVGLSLVFRVCVGNGGKQSPPQYTSTTIILVSLSLIEIKKQITDDECNRQSTFLEQCSNNNQPCQLSFAQLQRYSKLFACSYCVMGLGHLQKCYKLDGRVKRPLEALELEGHANLHNRSH